MELWYNEHYPHVDAKLSLKIKDVLYTGKSEFQTLEVLDTVGFGKVLLLDGLIMLTERDEFVYHEMISHVPVNVHPNPQKILVIGAGDGGTITEVLKHPEVQELDLVEIDKLVSDVSRDHFPQFADAFNDPRLTCHWQDGIKFVAKAEKQYDIIIIDSTDPIGPGEGLFTTKFYQNCFEILSNNGILVNQSESPQYTPAIVKSIHKKLSAIFPVFAMYQAFIPTYPSGHWMFSFASKNLDPIKDQKPNRWIEKKIKTKYYNPSVHAAAFALPNFVLNMTGEL
ncbi:MAG: polyamine aminopropyltransferase, partial [Calditrichaeota bacterium]|nr:polyamine aminopropyltransferase [Calditrichota bacterium]